MKKESRAWKKEDWMSYLKKNSKKYRSFEEFKRNDKKGWALDSAVYKYNFISKSNVLSFWTPTFEKREDRAMKQLARTLKKLKSVRDIKTEVRLDKKSRVDMVITTSKNRVILIEGKHDNSFWSKDHTSSQISRYEKIARKKYKSKYQKTILCSPNGKYGLSFNQLSQFLRAL